MDSTAPQTQRPAKPEKMPVRFDSIPPELTALPGWVVWAWSWNEKPQKWDKPPLTIGGRKASSTNPETWTSFDGASKAAAHGKHDGIGFVLRHDVGIVGIDLDDCRDPSTGEIHEPAASIIRKLDSYAEISPSGTGVKLFVRAKLPEKCEKVDHDTGVEVYESGRYFTVTGHRIEGTPATINERQAQVEWLLRTWVKPFPKSKENLGRFRGADDIETARSALSALCGARADGYDDWLRVGMSLKSVSDSLLPDWDSWSRQSSKYTDGVCAEKWRSFNGQGVGPGTLFHWAKEDGWQPPRRTKTASQNAPASVEDAIGEIPHHVVTNGVRIEEPQEDGSAKEKLVSLSMREIIERTDKQTKAGIRRVDSALFVHDPEHGIGWLEKSQSLFGWLARNVGKVTWHLGPSMVQQGQLFAEYQRTAPRFVSVESLPHEPPMRDHYYACPEIKPGDGSALRTLLARFAPATDLDGDLILAAFLTPLWGGPPGCRPAFVITSDDGRGAGKSTLAEMVGAVYDGVLQFSHQEDIANIKTRLLSPEALTRRVALIDNIKSNKFSWGELEAIITASTIGGRRLYVGEATRPNTLTWFLTLNGAALSTDMAQRAIIIKVRKPERSATWFEETAAYIRQNQRVILGDVVAALRGPVTTPLREFTRWATWERDVLQRLPEPSDAQKVIIERQQAVDVDEEESTLVEEYFADQLRGFGYDVDAERVFIPSQVTARWYGWATNQRTITVIAASRTLSQLATEGRLRRLSISAGRSWGRGFIWTGENWPGMHTAIDLQERIRDQHVDNLGKFRQDAKDA